MPATSSRIMIEPVDGARPLSDRFIDRLLGWWDVGGGRSMRRALRGAVAAGSTKIRTLLAPFLGQPLVAKTVSISLATLATLRRWIGKAFSTEVGAATPQRAEMSSAEVADTARTHEAPTPVRPAIATRTGTAEIRTPLRSSTGEIRTPLRSATAEIRTPTRTGTVEIRPHLRSGTGEIRSRTAASITRPTLTPVSSTQLTAMTTNLRCWSCLQRNRVRTPRRGGCFLCTACNTTMLVVDPIVGLTCDVGQAQTKGIDLNRQADETDPG